MKRLIILTLLAAPTAAAASLDRVPILQDNGTVTVNHRYDTRTAPTRTLVDGVDATCRDGLSKFFRSSFHGGITYRWTEPTGVKAVLLCNTFATGRP